jgi:hypothetical protein
MKISRLFLLLILFANQSLAQRISAKDYKFLQKKEDSLKLVGLKIVQGRNAADRLYADSVFTRMLVKALVTKNSFYYPFDSIINISKLYAPDSSFRIYTWQLSINENMIRQHGAIQMRTDDGSFKPFVLIDKSDVTKTMVDTIGNNLGWIGAVYYKIIQKNYNNHTYYTLLGFDENNIKSDKKIMDILEFVDGKPVFGNKLFVMERESSYPKNAARFIMEFKKEASPKLSYDKDLDAIVFDELVSETNEPKKKWTLVADGEYEGFKWKEGKWIHSTTIFGNAPIQKTAIPKPIRDNKGNIDDSKLKGSEQINNAPPNY